MHFFVSYGRDMSECRYWVNKLGAMTLSTPSSIESKKNVLHANISGVFSI